MTVPGQGDRQLFEGTGPELFEMVVVTTTRPPDATALESSRSRAVGRH